MAANRKPEALRSSDLAFVGIGVAVFLLALGAVTGVGVASFIFGGGWMWPHGMRDAARELGGLLVAKPGSGLPRAQAHRVPSAPAVYVFVVLAELAAVAAAAGLARLLMTTWRPSDARSGLATHADASQALGRQRITRQRAAEIRPDLYGKRSDQ